MILNVILVNFEGDATYMHPLKCTANSAFFVLFTLIGEDHGVYSFFFIDEGHEPSVLETEKTITS